jgi:hypothetical protein
MFTSMDLFPPGFEHETENDETESTKQISWRGSSLAVLWPHSCLTKPGAISLMIFDDFLLDYFKENDDYCTTLTKTDLQRTDLAPCRNLAILHFALLQAVTTARS